MTDIDPETLAGLEKQLANQELSSAPRTLVMTPATADALIAEAKANADLRRELIERKAQHMDHMNGLNRQLGSLDKVIVDLRREIEELKRKAT